MMPLPISRIPHLSIHATGRDVNLDACRYDLDRERTYYDDTGLDLAGNNYYYRIYVYDAGGKNSRSNEVTTAP